MADFNQNYRRRALEVISLPQVFGREEESSLASSELSYIGSSFLTKNQYEVSISFAPDLGLMQPSASGSHRIQITNKPVSAL